MSERVPGSSLTPNKGPAQKGSPNSLGKRRSSRVAIDMPVEIFGQAANGKVFREETRTTNVSAHGAALVLVLTPGIKPSILLVNKKTGMEVQCRVISQKETDKGIVELAVEFITPQPRFWGIAFPPEDWDMADRKKPTPHSK